ncbi:AEC family transporter [Methanosphaera sp.]
MDVFGTVLSIFVIILVGFFARFFGVLSRDDADSLNRVVMYIGLPCLIFGSIYSNWDFALISSLRWMPLVSISCVIIMTCICYVLFSCMKLSDARKWSLLSLVIIGNTGFVGFPVILGVYGQAGFVRAIFFNLTDAFIMIVIYLAFVLKFGGSYSKVVNRIVKFPMLWALVIALVFSVFQLPVPEVVSTVVGYLGDLTIPLIILFIGLSIDFNDLGDNIGLTLLASFLKLVLFPVVAFIVLKLIGLSGFDFVICMVQAAMPSAMISLSYIIEFDLDVNLSSNVIMFDTLLSLASLSILMSIL